MILLPGRPATCGMGCANSWPTLDKEPMTLLTHTFGRLLIKCRGLRKLHRRPNGNGSVRQAANRGPGPQRGPQGGLWPVWHRCLFVSLAHNVPQTAESLSNMINSRLVTRVWVRHLRRSAWLLDALNVPSCRLVSLPGAGVMGWLGTGGAEPVGKTIK
jgi:hypothetical protein